jgi:hypothetical protein
MNENMGCKGVRPYWHGCKIVGRMDEQKKKMVDVKLFGYRKGPMITKSVNPPPPIVSKWLSG